MRTKQLTVRLAAIRRLSEELAAVTSRWRAATAIVLALGLAACSSSGSLRSTPGQAAQGAERRWLRKSARAAAVAERAAPVVAVPAVVMEVVMAAHQEEGSRLRWRPSTT